MNTPEIITNLDENEIFVFGSNKSGFHMGGAARIAYEKFGAVWGEGEGRTGSCYAIPTLKFDTESQSLVKVSPQELTLSIASFLHYAFQHTELTFLTTKIGTGIAGWSMEEVSKMFYGAQYFSNVIIPKEFEDILLSNIQNS